MLRASLAPLALTCLLIGPSLAHGDDAPDMVPAPPPEAPPAEPVDGGAPPDAQPGAQPAAKPADAFDFDLFADPGTPKLRPALVPDAKRQEHERRVKLRRKMLTLHQAFGFTTLGVMALQLVLGQLHYLDKYGGGDLTNRFQMAHLTVGIASTASFAATGILAVAAPNPFERKLKVDRALFHKVMMTLATAGMVAQMIMGPVSASLDGNLNQRGLALGHLVTGYATWAFLASGMLAFVF